jgi:hypothetical protein
MGVWKHKAIVTAYRTLLRHGLKAVHHSTPARYKLRDILRSSFRESSNNDFNPKRVANTVRFLKRAEIYNGYEHKILKNIVHVRYWRDQPHPKSLTQVNNPLTADIRMNSWSQFSATVAMLNESQELCLKT